MYATPPLRERMTGMAAAVGLQVALLSLLIGGFGVTVGRSAGDAIQAFEVAPDRPPPPPVQRLRTTPERPRRAEGRAAPPNLRSKATEVVAPAPAVAIVLPPRVVVAPKAGPADDASSGATERPGPGTGVGGVGDGLGAGDRGSGDGGGGGGAGGGGGDHRPPIQRAGSLQGARMPPELWETGFEGVVSVRYVVGVDGRPSDCSITRSSGNRAIDAATCRQIERAFRFRPSRDGYGRPVPAVIVQDHEWVIERERDRR